VVVTTEKLAVSASGGRIAGAMAADIVKAMEHAVVIAGDEERLADEVEGKVVAWFGRLMDMADELPGGREDFFLFVGKDFRAEIERCGEGGCASDIAIGIGLKIGHERASQFYRRVKAVQRTVPQLPRKLVSRSSFPQSVVTG
jgi:hypothetical protein